MANRQSSTHEARRLGLWVVRTIGRELRVARITSGMTQSQVGARLRRSASHVSRVEHGLIEALTLPQIFQHAAVVGLKPFINLYPLISRPLDQAQLELFRRFRERIGSVWRITLEATMPAAGDLRAADALLVAHGCRIVVELITRFADFQAQLRAARRKARDLGADRIVFVVAATETNRRALRSAGPAVAEAFPIGTREGLRRLAAGEDPGADALILL